MKLRLVALLAAVPVLLAACASSPSTSSFSKVAAGSSDCPVAPVNVVVSVDQWGDIVSQLGGSCANVQTIVASSAVDPHDFSPSPSDLAKFSGAALVVVNGAGYDTWATQVLATVSPKPAVVDAGTVVGVSAGANPHLWYSPDYVTRTADAVTAQLQVLAPKASAYFAARRTAWQDSMKPYFAEIASIKAAAAGKTYGATESIFDYMAAALGLVDKTPQGYQNASTNGSEPAPGDVQAFQQMLAGRQMDVLIFNTQTVGAVPDQIKQAATSASVPVVDVTETVAPGATSFVGWQLSQLTALAKALGVPA